MELKETKFKEGYISNIQCRNCIHSCKDCSHSGECINFMVKIGKNEQKNLLREIRYQNINIGKFCKNNHLKIVYFKKMIYGKIPYSYKAYTLLKERLEETEEWIYESEKWDVGENII